MTNILQLEKRGCDFWKNCEEKKASDLENFRLVGKIQGKDNQYILEIITHEATDKKIIKNRKEKFGVGAVCSWIDNTYARDEETTWADGTKTTQKRYFRDMDKLDTYCQPTKKAVIETINKVFGCNYDGLEIVDSVNLDL